MFNSASTAKAAMNGFLSSQNVAQTVFYEPLYSQVNLAGFADRTSGFLSTQEITFFAAGVGQTGQGWQQSYVSAAQPQPRPLTQAQTNLKDSGKIPAGQEFIADSLGVDLFTTAPIHITDWLTSETSLYQERLSTQWDCGASRYWPCAEYGTSSKSAAVSGGTQTYIFPTNGSTTARRLPADGSLFFPAKQQIIFKMRIHKDVYTNETNAVASPTNPISANCVVAVVMTGWRFNVVSA